MILRQHALEFREQNSLVFRLIWHLLHRSRETVELRCVAGLLFFTNMSVAQRSDYASANINCQETPYSSSTHGFFLLNGQASNGISTSPSRDDLVKHFAASPSVSQVTCSDIAGAQVNLCFTRQHASRLSPIAHLLFE